MALFTVFGNPIAHSLSPAIHQAFAAQAGITLRYTRSLTSTAQFRRAVATFFHQGGAGANVTAPFKQQAFALVNQLTPRAQLAGAVNTLVPLGQGQLLGDNTDGVGLVHALQHHCQQLLTQRVIVICGAGGATRGVLGPLLAQQVDHIVIANRTLSRAQELVAAVRDARVQAVTYEQLRIPVGALVIQATSTDHLPLTDEQLASAAAWYDMRYGAQPTFMMQRAQQAGVPQVYDGLSMLVEQAAVAFQLWHPDIELDTEPVLTQLRAQLMHQGAEIG